MPIYKNSQSDGIMENDNTPLIKWTDSLLIGIELIDNQHKQLVSLTNELYKACKLGGDELDAVFKETMSRVVEYVRFHFGVEQEMLQRVKFPNYASHKAEHDSFVKTVLETTKEYGNIRRFVPNNFCRFLRDWIVGHIGHLDKIYAAYIVDQMRKGLITNKDISG